jgi:hypothetical protein
VQAGALGDSATMCTGPSSKDEVQVLVGFHEDVRDRGIDGVDVPLEVAALDRRRLRAREGRKLGHGLEFR